jgi:hypothetical protein
MLRSDGLNRLWTGPILEDGPVLALGLLSSLVKSSFEISVQSWARVLLNFGAEQASFF